MDSSSLPQAPPQAPPPPPRSRERSPADLAIEAEGGEILPPEFGGPQSVDFKDLTPVVEHLGPGPAAAKEGPGQRVIDVPGGVFTPGARPPGMPEPPGKSKAQIELEEYLEQQINFECNVLDNCLTFVQNMVRARVRMTPLDSADVQQALWGAGARSPLETAEPQLALEVYKNVRRNMRDEAKAARPRGFIRRFMARIFG